MPRIRIVYVIGTLDVGGTEGQLVELASGLDRTRFAATVCCLSGAGPLEQVLRARGIDVHVMAFRGIRRSLSIAFVRELPGVLRSIAGFVAYLRATSPDIVHGMLFESYVLGAIAARAAGVPVVVAGRRSLGLFKAGKPAHLFVERLTNPLTDLIIANSVAVKNDVIRQERVRPGKIIVIHNGVDSRRYSVSDPRPSRSADWAPRVAVLANLIGYKGHSYFIEAWRTVQRQHPTATALLIGDGPMRGELEALVAAKGLDDSVRFLGRRDDVAAILSSVDCVVHPSLQEGFSNAILEAMAMGKPVVATDVGGNREAVVDGETGYLVPPADPDAMAGAILRILADPERLAEFGAAGRQRVEQHFSIARMIRAYEVVYEDLLASKGWHVAVGPGS